MAQRIPTAAETDSARENRKWHLSWLIASLVAVVVGAILAWSGLDMIPSILLVAIGCALATALLWLMTPRRLHTVLKICATLILVICALVSAQWIYRFDRPMLSPEIGGIITRGLDRSGFTIDVEALVKNAGRQSGYADRWELELDIDGTKVDGTQLYGQPLPPSAVSEQELYNQEFPPGKPVRGWLFFGFPSVSRDYAKPYFVCGSGLTSKVNLRLSVWDSKAKSKFTQITSLTDLGKAACSPLQPTSPASRPGPAQPQSGGKKPKSAPGIQQNGGIDNQANPVTVNGNQTTNGSDSPIINGSNNSGGKPK